jgi:lecithin:retinol acyltransferase
MFRRTGHALVTHDSRLEPGDEPPLASHLVTPRALYTHHGIYIGNGRVIHYAGLARGLWRAPVEDVSLDCFARGRAIRIRRDRRVFDRGEVVERARSRLGERSYRILTNNCEHFCAWALRGESRSWQVERFIRLPRAAWRRLRGGWQRIARFPRALGRATTG